MQIKGQKSYTVIVLNYMYRYLFFRHHISSVKKHIVVLFHVSRYKVFILSWIGATYAVAGRPSILV